jgi:uroporphyrinogen-III synthase
LPGRQLPAGMQARIAAIGPATRRAIEKAGAVVTLVPSDSRQEGLVELLRPLAQGWRVLLPIAAGGRALLAEKLRGWGCKVDVVTAYRTVPNAELGQPPAFDAAIFASPSALRAYLETAGRQSLARKTVVVIGRTTAGEAAANGIPVGLAATPDIHSLISVLAETRPNQGER